MFWELSCWQYLTIFDATSSSYSKSRTPLICNSRRDFAAIGFQSNFRVNASNSSDTILWTRNQPTTLVTIHTSNNISKKLYFSIYWAPKRKDIYHYLKFRFLGKNITLPMHFVCGKEKLWLLQHSKIKESYEELQHGKYVTRIARDFLPSEYDKMKKKRCWHLNIS